MNKGDYKRSRSEEEEEDIFAKSKKVIRSPNIKNKGKDMEVESLKAMFENMMEQMKLEMRRNTEEVKLEMNKLRKEMQVRESQWENEKRELESRIRNLEDKVDREERLKRKNNIVVKKLKTSDGNEREKIEKFINEELKIKVNIAKAYKINRGKENEMIVAEVESWEQKQNIMRKKQMLKGKDIFIDNDLTAKERQIQNQIVEISKVEKKRGKNVRVGYRKLFIEEKVFVWDEREQGVKEQEVLKKSDLGQSSKNQ